MEKNNRNPQESHITWETSISLWTNPLLLKQLGLMLLSTYLLMAVLFSFLLLVTGEPEGIPSVLLMSVIAVIGIGFLLILTAALVFKNRFHVRFTVDTKGVLWETLDKRSLISSRLAIWLGILGKSAQTSGAGSLAMSREKEWIGWKEIDSVQYDQGRSMIILRNSWRPVMMLVCRQDNYEDVACLVKTRCKKSVKGQLQRQKSPIARSLLNTFLVFLASAPVFMLPYPFELDILVPLIMLLFALATVWLAPFMGIVVIGCALFLSVQIIIISLEVKESLFASVGMYRNFEVFDGADWFLLALTFIGLTYLVWFCLRVLRGKVFSALFIK